MDSRHAPYSLLSFPRKRESSVGVVMQQAALNDHLIPAFAGMTQ